jgi:glycosyltransferase involved in cell wall biosynthesis
MNNLRLLYSSNAFWAKSGYGVQGASLLPRLANLDVFGGKENIAQFAWYGLQGGQHSVEGFTVYPSGSDPYGNDVIASHTRHFNANVVVTLIDAWVLDNVGEKIKPSLWLPWLPVDHITVPDKVLYALESAYLPLSYSKDGHQKLLDRGVDNRYIPHGIETNEFKILEADKVQQFKQKFLNGFDGHLSMMVAANKGYPDRKAFQVQLRAWAKFAEEKPDARLYLHTEPTPMYGGIDLPKLCNQLGIADKVIFPDRYQLYLGYPAEYLAYFYNASDILLSAGMGEGFGIPIIEAQACGTPVIVTNGTSMPELVRYGTITEPLDIFYTPMEAFQLWPDHAAITDALNENYQERKAPEVSQKASQAIHDEYNWDTLVKDYWQPLFDEVKNELSKPEEKTEEKQSLVTHSSRGKIVP